MNTRPGVRYTTIESVPVTPWLLTGAIYQTAVEAKFAAAFLWVSCNNKGVRVKKIKKGWTVLFWR